MKPMLLVTLTILLSLQLAACSYKEIERTDSRSVKTYFWTRNDAAIVHRLYIDDNFKGELPYLPDSLTRPGSNTAKKKGLALTLPPGKYKLVVKDPNDNIISQGSLLIRLSGRSTEFSSSWDNNKCSVEVIYE